MAKKRSSTIWLLVIGASLVGAAVWGRDYVTGGSEISRQIEGAKVERGDVRISVIERGNLKAAESVTLKSELEGQSTVLWLIEEGKLVQPGDLLCELDTSGLVDRQVQQEIRVQNAHAAFVKAQQNHAIQQSQNRSDIRRAERELRFSKLDLEKFKDGDLPQELQRLDEDILIADEELSRATQDLKWSEELASRGFLEQTQLETDRLSKTRTEVRHRQAQRAKELYESYEVPRRTEELEAEVDEKMSELERVKLQATARIADYEADLRSSEATYNLEKSDLAKLEKQIDGARLIAPVAGMVVYAVENEGRWGGGEPMQEGRSVRERQDIITIPSAEGYVAEVSLHESVLEKVTTGMPCLVTVDALKEAFAGEVSFKAVLPDQQSRWSNPDLRVYRTVVRVHERDPRVRPGMSCSVEILVDELDDALYVPVQCVFFDAAGAVCFVAGGGEVEKRPVTVGANNGRQVVIESGLEEGEVVLLSAPAGRLMPAEAGDDEDAGSWDRARSEAGQSAPEPTKQRRSSGREERSYPTGAPGASPTGRRPSSFGSARTEERSKGVSAHKGGEPPAGVEAAARTGGEPGGLPPGEGSEHEPNAEKAPPAREN